MRSDVSSEITTLLNARRGHIIRVLYWIRAKNRSTGEEEALGIWNGEDTQQFVIGLETRVYIGGGGFLAVGNLKREMNLNIQQLTITGNPVSPEFIDALRLYDPKGAKVEIHLVFFDPETNQQVGLPYRWYKGWLNTAPIRTPEKNGQATVELNHVGHSRILTRLLPSKRSDDSQRRRLSTDTFFKYVTISGAVETPWGQK